jgi:hypothetical protein
MTVDDLLTVADRVALLVNALANERDHKPVVKLFTPDGAATWLLSESAISGSVARNWGTFL